MNNDPAHISALFVGLISLISTPEIARLVGPYAAIFVCACAGSAAALTFHSETFTTKKAIVFVSIRVLIAWSLTVSIALLLQKHAGVQADYAVAPIAVALGAIKDFREVWGFVVKTALEWKNGKPNSP